MKLSLAVVFSAIAAATSSSIKSNSAAGRNVLENARRLNNNNNNNNNNKNNNNNNNGEYEVAEWLMNYSLKFQGCHHIYQWNDNVDEDNDVRLYSKRLVRFRMCPADSCSATNGGGCNADYGDYIIDMDTYLQNYYQAKWQAIEQECQNLLENTCACQNNGDDQYNEASCQYDCVINAGMDQCVDYINDENQGEKFQVENYLQCAQYQPANNNGRKLEEEEQGYYIGPYCSGQGGAILLGLFSDDTCTTFAGEYGGKTLFESMSGYELPYAEDSIVDADCMACSSLQQDNDQAVYEMNQACAAAYTYAGKCETKLPSGTASSIDTNGCSYIEGIKTVRENGMVTVLKGSSSAVATSFIVIFAIACAAMGWYVWYLRTRLGMKTETLL